MNTTRADRKYILGALNNDPAVYGWAIVNFDTGKQITSQDLISDIDTLESLVKRQAELLERSKHWVILAKAHEHWESLQEGTAPDYDAEDQFLKDLEALGEE
jgi:hypothetical protein